MNKRNNRESKWRVVMVVLTGILVVGITEAFMFRVTKKIENDFVPAVVSCEVVESFDGDSKNGIRIKNGSTEQNTEAYLRVKMISYWQDANGDIVGKASKMPIVSYDTTNWLKASDSDIYYYIEAVGQGGMTEELLTSPILLETDVYDDKTVYQVVEVFAEAVQSRPVDAVQEAWKVSVDETTTKITNVP